MSIAPGLLNLTFSQGATWKLAMTYTNSTSDPIDLTDYTARMQARQSYDSGTPVLSLTNGSGIALGGTNNYRANKHGATIPDRFGYISAKP